MRAVVFDFFGTVAGRVGGPGSGDARVYEAHGYRLDLDREREYFLRYDGIEHLEHSVDRETYEAWSRFRVGELARDCGVAPEHIEALVDDVRALDTFGIVAYPDAVPTLTELRSRGYLVAICSNWGWDLDLSLAQAGLTDHLDAAVTSARAGSRKPHPRIFALAAKTIGVSPSTVVFVGDSMRPDVEGALAVGMAAVHIARPEAGPPPPLPDGARRVSSLREMLDWPELARIESGPGAAPH
ncbi:MAG: HAD family hydrolase [Acidimicrobiales bacterium]